METLQAASSDLAIHQRKEKVLSFLKQKYEWVSYAFLALIVALALWIRTLPMKLNPSTGKPGLWDVAANHWTLGPDLDPFLFLRWAKEIIANGSVAAWDYMRYVPLGYNTGEELVLLSYMIAWFHKIAAMFGSPSVDYSAVLFPAVMFGLTAISFFLLTREIFVNSVGKLRANIIGLIASLFLTLIPALLPRTIAGIPEKESVGFLFMFLAFYFFLLAWKSERPLKRYIHALLAAAATTIMALVWGGFVYIYIIIAITVLISFFLGQCNLERTKVYIIWLLVSIIVTVLSTLRYTFTSMATSTTTGTAVFVGIILIVHHILIHPKIYKIYHSTKLARLPQPLLSLLASIVLALIAGTIFFGGPSFFIDKLVSAKNTLVSPITDRIGVTVAENRQPFFSEWAASFGPYVNGLNIPLLFWLFFFGSIYLFYHLLSPLTKREQRIATLSYFIFLCAIIFSRYNPNSVLNGTSVVSLLVYFGGFALLIAVLGYYYWQYYKRAEHEKLASIEIGLILLFVFFFLSIVSARGAVRVIMVLVPPASIIVSYFVVNLFVDAKKAKEEDITKILAWIAAIVVCIAAFYAAFYFYSASKDTARSYIPSGYTQQWQYAMKWVRDTTPTDAVFGHWWDYGYWVQSIGERATVLDGGNAIGYWNHLMGRHALTGSSNQAALEYLYTHNTTHFLIDSTDIGKYAAFSSIGADENYDRSSWIPTFLRDPQQTQETKNTTLLVYTGGTALDQDIVYNLNGTQILLPTQDAGLGALIVEINSSGAVAQQPIGIYVRNNAQYRIPLRYAYREGIFTDFGSGLQAGIFVMPRLIQTNAGFQVDREGALLYLTNRTVLSQLARLYLYKENNPYFELVHSQDDFVVSELKRANATSSDFIYFDGLRGPIRIWEIHYPDTIRANPDYLSTQYPDRRLYTAE